MDLDERWFKEMTDELEVGVYIVDRERLVSYWNRGAELISGFSAAEVVGHQCHANILRHIDHEGTALCLHGCPLLATIQDGERREAAIYLHHKSGHRVPVTVRTRPLRDGRGRIIGAIEIFQDNSEQMSALRRIDELRKLALIDELTGIANRRYTEMTLVTRLNEYRQHGWPFAVVFIDVDDLKGVNDRHGHDVGDRLLAAVAQTLAGNLRAHDFVGRWGGDEFLVLLRRIESLDNVAAIAERLRTLVSKSTISHEQVRIRVSASFGATAVTEEDDDTTVVERADKLMYDSKAAGRDRVTVR
jgi:diguanylate cyclase (GGDEF)-like protein/PAS domain S-box-containing protein